jgi:hypothetical protein
MHVTTALRLPVNLLTWPETSTVRTYSKLEEVQLSFVLAGDTIVTGETPTTGCGATRALVVVVLLADCVFHTAASETSHTNVGGV